MWNRASRLQGHKDTPLTMKGVKQAQALGFALKGVLKNKTPSFFYSSPIGRAKQTAAIISDIIDFDVERIEYKSSLKEITFGDWDGLNMEEILEKEMPPEETNELANVKPEVTFDDFKKLDIRIGTVEKVEEHPNADKLWLLDVNFGGPVKRIVTGLRGIYEHKDLLGKKIAVLVNLAPAKFRGEQSNGMLLAAEGEGIVSLLDPDKDIEDGSEVH